MRTSTVSTRFGGLLCSTMFSALTLCAQTFIPNTGALNFVYQAGGPSPAPQTLFINGLSLAQFKVTTVGAWLNVQPSSGMVPASLAVAVNPPPNATPGVLTGSITISPPVSVDASSNVTVSVTLQILASQGNISLSTRNVSFNYVLGGPLAMPVGVSVSSPTLASFTAVASTNNGLPWLVVSPTSGTTPATLTLYATPTSTMRPGVYNGTVTVQPGYVGGVAQTISVTLTLTESGTLVASPQFLLFNYQPGEAAPISQAIYLTGGSSGSVSFEASASTTSGGNWINIQPVTGTTPRSVIISVSTANVPPGTHYGTISFRGTAGVTPTQVSVTYTVYSYSQLITSPGSLVFNHISGAPYPNGQYVSVTSTGSATSFSASVSGPSWINVSSSSGKTPSSLFVSISPPSGTPPGNYTANLIVSPTGAGNSSSVSISAVITQPNNLTVGRTTATFNAASSAPNPPPVVVPVGSTGGSLRFDAYATTSSPNSSWLRVAQSSSYTPANVTITVNPAGLATGSHLGTVLITSETAGNTPQRIDVTLTIASTPFLDAAPFGMAFSYQLGGALPPIQLASIVSTGIDSGFTLKASTDTGPWLVTASQGSTPGTIAAGIDPRGMDPGAYSGSIQVTPDDPTVLPVEMPVILNVSPGPVFAPSANLVAFQYRRSGPAPASQKVNLAMSSGSSSTVFFIGSRTGDGGNWLSVTPNAGATPGTITVSVNPESLVPGIYEGVIQVQDAAGIVLTSYIAVRLQVTDDEILTVPSQPLFFNAIQGAPNPPGQQVSVFGTGRSSSFRVTTTSAGWLVVDQATGVTDGAVTVRASTGNLAAGYYLGSVVIDIPNVPKSSQIIPVLLVITEQ